MILVVDNNKTTYIEKYKLFYHAVEAIEYANKTAMAKSGGTQTKGVELLIMNY